MRCEILTVLAASWLLLLGGGRVTADDKEAGDRLPEPALYLAKEATRRVTEMEFDWLKLAEALTKRQADFQLTEGARSDSSLREQATRLLAAGKGLLTASKRTATELERFKDALRKAASHYREVASLCKAQAGEARADAVKADYLELAKVYEANAQAAEGRAKALSAPADTKAREEVIEEGNLFLERFVEALAVGPVKDADRGLLAARLTKHGERCKTLTDELSRTANQVLEGADAPEIRAKIDEGRKKGWLPPPPRKELPALAGASWTCTVTIEGVSCVQVLRFNLDGTCSQAVYRAGPKGKGALLVRGSATYELDPDGHLYFKQGGFVIEAGRVELLGKDRWSYEIYANVLNPQAAGTKLVLTRVTGP